ncbi:hypothetical protein ABK040_007122 [Willaertia magna]
MRKSTFIEKIETHHTHNSLLSPSNSGTVNRTHCSDENQITTSNELLNSDIKSIQLQKLNPPFRFRCVAPNIYIGAYPTLRNFRYLKRLKLKTIISLIPEKPITDLVEFCEFEHIHSYHFFSPKYKEQVSLSFSEVSRIIEMFLNTNYHPIYCHCLDGTQVSSVLVMCLRKLQHWSKSAMKKETIRYINEELSSEDFDFVKQWKGPIKIDKRFLPNWFYNCPSLTPLITFSLNKRLINDEEDYKHITGIKIIIEGEEQDKNQQQLLSPTTESADSSDEELDFEEDDSIVVQSKTPFEDHHIFDSNSPKEQQQFPSFVDPKTTNEKDKPSFIIRGLDLGFTSEEQRKKLILWKNEKLSSLYLPNDVERFLDDMDDPFLQEDYLSFVNQ